MKLRRREFLHLAAGAAALPAASRIATAQTYPTRPITMIVPFPPGSATDAIGRVVAEPMRRLLGQPVISKTLAERREASVLAARPAPSLTAI
jgi:tripartite-type tricarboxylate transporter receptor subunit TctC